MKSRSVERRAFAWFCNMSVTLKVKITAIDSNSDIAN